MSQFQAPTTTRERKAPGEKVPMPPMNEAQVRLLSMLYYQRPAGEKGEEDFIERFIQPLIKLDTVLKGYKDEIGNYLFTVGVNPTSMFSCHTDTVHPRPAKNYRNRLECHVLGDTRFICTDGNSQLGADDAVGIWIMIAMIEKGIPGLYIFHRMEEKGGLGSQFIATKTPDVLKGIQRAIAFDRKDTTSIITHQSFGRCCSDEFADALAKGLHLNQEKDDTGIFTDTANYTDLVGECTNISAGYYMEHSFVERLDIDYAEQLRLAVLDMDWDALPTKRKPGEVDPEDFSYTNYPSYTGYKYASKAAGYWDDDDDWDKPWDEKHDRKRGKISSSRVRATSTEDNYAVSYVKEYSYKKIKEYIKSEPEAMAYLIHMSFTLKEVEDAILDFETDKLFGDTDV